VEQVSTNLLLDIENTVVPDVRETLPQNQLVDSDGSPIEFDVEKGVIQVGVTFNVEGMFD
jgi:hypothetical protein